jgi:hypothetical protein
MKGQKTGGRRKGTPNRATADVKTLAGVYTPEAVRLLAAVMRNKKAPLMARVMAADKLLDRACGRPAQALSGPSGTGPVTLNLIEEIHPVEERQTR